MGTCQTGESQSYDPVAVSTLLEGISSGAPWKRNLQRANILFLGTTGSGKTTICKQLKRICGDETFLWAKRRRNEYLHHIHYQCISQMQKALHLLKQRLLLFSGYVRETELKHNMLISVRIGYEIEAQILSFYDDISPYLSPVGNSAADYIRTIDPKHCVHFDYQIVASLRVLWSEQSIKKLYEQRNVTNIAESSCHFWNKLDLMSERSYKPNVEDVMLISRPTKS